MNGVNPEGKKYFGKILVTDDIKAHLYVVSTVLTAHKIEIETAPGAAEALARIISGDKYDLILTGNGEEDARTFRDMGQQAAAFSKPIDNVEIEALLESFSLGEKAARKKKLRESFVRDGEKTMERLSSALAAGLENPDVLKNFIISAHGIKSALYNIGETELAKEAQVLEASAKAADITYPEKYAPPFLEALATLIDKYKTKNGYQTQEDPADLRENLTYLAEKCAAYNRKGALDILDAITHAAPPTRDALEKIKGHILATDFDEAENLTRQFLLNH